MARMRTREKNKSPWPLRALLAICILLILVALLYLIYQRTRPQPQQPPVAQDQPTQLLSEDRIIFAGTPREKTPGTLNVTILKNKAYTVGFSTQRKVPLWAAYRVIRKENPYILERPKGDFQIDSRIPIRLTHQDYTGSGYDRGHMTPNSAIARCFGREAQLETFLMTNICPQSPNLNQKVWENLERAELTYANKFGELWVVDGPILPGLKVPAPSLGEASETPREGRAPPVKKLRSGVHIPEAFFKILVHDASGGRGLDVHARAVIMPQNVKGHEPASQFTCTISQVESETGLEFLWQLPPEIQQRLKSTSATLWPVNPN